MLVPLAVPNWAENTFPTAKSLNLALYTCDGTLNNPNGIGWNALRYLTFEVIGERGLIITFNSAPTSGTRNVIGNSGETYPGVTILDTAGYYGESSDGTYWIGGYSFKPAIAGGVGDGVTPGGLTLICHFVPVSVASTTDAVGADLENNGVLVNSGARQRPPGATGAFDCTPFYLDIAETSAAKMEPAVLVVDSASASTSLDLNDTDSSGATPRFFTMWAGVSDSQYGNYGTPAIPAPYTGYTSATTIGTSGSSNVDINGAHGVAGPANFLANPPLYRNALQSSQSIPNTTATKVTLNSTAIDNYTGYTSANSTYTVQRAGLYLAGATVPFAASTGGRRNVGIAVNGTTYWGPGYQACQAGTTIATKTQAFSLQAGDTVTLEVEQDSGGSLALSSADVTRIFLVWLGEEGVPSTLWTPPDTTFRWQAGTPGTSLPGLMQTHLANDLGFLCQRPYLLSYQTSAQTGFANNSTQVVVMDTAGGIVHADNGDNYSGFNTTSSVYTAQVAGWYLAIYEAFATYAGTPSTASLVVGLQTSSSGGRSPSASIDWYQQMFPSSASFPPGGTAVGLYYLAAGETIRPMIEGQSYTASTWGTTVTGVNSHFELVWVSN